ncbi:hypothetical protein CEXT_751911 [Caerostris extrusa]|uniref:Uncharacterized protein n=1 Tax=Caerostris extrusa TaxID=172846 RepID=A0AAV4TGU5_CAEEX|nr:hypothetical protein CEXT_751911 [Caerostris extrusa]
MKYRDLCDLVKRHYSLCLCWILNKPAAFVTVKHLRAPKLPAISAWSKLITLPPSPPTAGLRTPANTEAPSLTPPAGNLQGLLDLRIYSRTVGFCQLHQEWTGIPSSSVRRTRQIRFNELLNPSRFFRFGDATGGGVDCESIR